MENQSLMQRYESAVRTNMKSAEEYTSSEDRRGFVTGAVLKLWEVCHQSHQINEGQFDKLIGVLSEYAGGGYRDFIQEQVKMYRSGNPPIILGY